MTRASFARKELTPWRAAAFDAAAQVGHSPVDDLNQPAAVGVGATPSNAVDGVRMSAALTPLEPARGRANLTIRADVLVDQVVISNTRATGV